MVHGLYPIPSTSHLMFMSMCACLRVSTLHYSSLFNPHRSMHLLLCQCFMARMVSAPSYLSSIINYITSRHLSSCHAVVWLDTSGSHNSAPLSTDNSSIIEDSANSTLCCIVTISLMPLHSLSLLGLHLTTPSIASPTVSSSHLSLLLLA